MIPMNAPEDANAAAHRNARTQRPVTHRNAPVSVRARLHVQRNAKTVRLAILKNAVDRALAPHLHHRVPRLVRMLTRVMKPSVQALANVLALKSAKIHQRVIQANAKVVAVVSVRRSA